MSSSAVRVAIAACLYLTAVLMVLALGLYVGHYLAAGLEAMSR